MYKLLSLFIIISTVFSSCTGSGSKRAISLTDLPQQLAKAAPGDTIFIKEGIYTDIQLALEGYGKEGMPIVIKAQYPGSVFVEGISNLRLSGEFIEVGDLHFRNGHSPKGAVIEFRNGDKTANHCRITECAINYFNPASRSTSGNWILLHGRNNRFDHNSIVGKLNTDVTLAVILSEEKDRENYHHIDHNYFGIRPILGSNGGETIRVGTSHHAFFSSNTIIENNMFHHCDGEVEVVSIKSSDNIVRNNVFLESAGVLALRHGNRNLVENNIFIGNGKPNTGGVRVVNEGHIIRNNFFYELKGDRFFAALALMNAVPNSLPNRYHHVKDVTIEENTFINCDHILFGVGRDNERTLPPSDILIKNNNFVNLHATEVFKSLDNISGFRFEDNKAHYGADIRLAGFKNDKTLSDKIELSTYTDMKGIGASWFVAEQEKPLTPSGNVIKVESGNNTLLQAFKQINEGDVVELTEEGEYWIDATLKIDRYVKIKASSHLKKRPVLRYNGSKKAAFITLMNGGKLDIEGIAFDGEIVPGKALAGGGISTLNEMITPYLLTVDNCEFYNFNESNIAAISGLKSTFSPQITIRNSYFHDMSGEGINYAGEKEDKGKYSVENLLIENCEFNRLLGSALNLYRGGNDESTSGPHLIVTGCNFENVDNKEQGSVLRLLGVQIADINHCNFSNSGRGGASIRFNEMSWDKISVSTINLWNSGRISSFWGKVEKGNITYKKL